MSNSELATASSFFKIYIPKNHGMNAIKDKRFINYHIFPKFIEESEDLEKHNFSLKTTSLQMMTS